jgi:hypothetical protein
MNVEQLEIIHALFLPDPRLISVETGKRHLQVMLGRWVSANVWSTAANAAESTATSASLSTGTQNPIASFIHRRIPIATATCE